MKRFIEKMRDPKERTYFYALFGGKLLGVSACFLVIFLVSLYVGSNAKIHAQENPAAAAATPAPPAAAPATPAPPPVSPHEPTS